MIRCAPFFVRAFKVKGSVDAKVFPSPVFISTIFPSCRKIPANNCVSKCFKPNVRNDISCVIANQSANISFRFSFFARNLSFSILSSNSSFVSVCKTNDCSLISEIIFFLFLLFLKTFKILFIFILLNFNVDKSYRYNILYRIYFIILDYITFLLVSTAIK